MPAHESLKPKHRVSVLTRTCPSCNLAFNVKGLAAHQRACGSSEMQRESDRRYEKKLIREQKLAKRLNRLRDHTDITMGGNDPGDPPEFEDDSDLITTLPPTNIDETAAREDQLNDIKVEYHPRSGLPSRVESIHKYRARERNRPLADQEPWKPFRTRSDFEFAEIALEAALNQAQTDTLIKFVRRCISKPASFTLNNHAELCKIWEGASNKLTAFKRQVVRVPYKGIDQDFEFHARPIWDWMLDMASDPILAPSFVWDAQRLYRFDGTSYVRFYTEPWTGNRLWDVQSSLPQGGKPFGLILYADKTTLSSFGTVKGYPIMARCAQLPVEIRNGQGLGGGRVVGWLPILNEDADKTGKLTFVNFKRVVWHESFRKLLDSIEPHSRTGCWHRCGDEIDRHLFPFVHILSADYEEQCIMSLIRGTWGLYPCPICLVPRDRQVNPENHKLRSAADMKALVEEAAHMRGTDADELLKPYGLRPVHNVFWRIKNSDVHRALSWDRMHAHHAGLFSKHLWVNLQEYIKEAGRDATTTVDKQMASLPRWRNLNHFDQVVGISYSDAVKYEDISKVILFAVHNIFDRTRHPREYLLLRCLRSYIELDIYTGLELHTAETISDGREALNKFVELLNEYAKLQADSDDSDKSWNFPKAHSNHHSFDDIEAKGVTRNFNTKPNEKLHGPLKESYRLRTNFKNVAGQILKIDHWCLVSTLIRAQIDEVDGQVGGDEDEDIEDAGPGVGTLAANSGHVKLGSNQGKCTFSALEARHNKDCAFNGFRIKLANFLSDSLPAYGIQLPDGKRIKLTAQDCITEYCFLKVHYESTVTWELVADYLRCSPQFHNHPRYDFVLVHTLDKLIFARLLFAFTIVIGNDTYPLVLIQPLDAAPGLRSVKEKELNLIRLRPKPRASSEFIFVRSIVRGAPVAEDFSKPTDFLVMDTVDPDLFLRLKSIQL